MSIKSIIQNKVSNTPLLAYYNKLIGDSNHDLIDTEVITDITRFEQIRITNHDDGRMYYKDIKKEHKIITGSEYMYNEVKDEDGNTLDYDQVLFINTLHLCVDKSYYMTIEAYDENNTMLTSQVLSCDDCQATIDSKISLINSKLLELLEEAINE